MSIIQGAVYQATYNAPSGTLAGSTVVLTVTAPDLTTSTPTPTVSGGTATASVPGTQVGQYLLVWVVTVANVDARQDQFSVVAAALDLVDLAEIKEDLRIAATDTTYDAQLRRWIKSATGVIQRITGPITPTTETYWSDGGTNAFVLPRRWVSSVTTVVETIGVVNYTLTEQPLGSSVNNYGYTWDRSINKIVRRGAAGLAINFTPGVNNVQCTYVAGMTVIPEDIQLGANALVKHFFKNGNQPAKALLRPTVEGEAQVQDHYFIPDKVLELITPYALTPGIF